MLESTCHQSMKNIPRTSVLHIGVTASSHRGGAELKNLRNNTKMPESTGNQIIENIPRTVLLLTGKRPN